MLDTIRENIKIFETNTALSENKILIGFLFLVYITLGEQITKRSRENLEGISKIPVVKYLIVSSIVFVMIQDLFVTFLVAGLYMILFDVILEPESKYSFLKKETKEKEVVKTDNAPQINVPSISDFEPYNF